MRGIGTQLGSAISLGLAALALVAVLATPALADVPHMREGSGEVGLMMGGYFFLAGQEGHHDTFNYRLHAGYNFSDMFGAELAIDIAPREVNRDSVLNINIDLMFYPITHEWIVPFIGIGPNFALVLPASGPTDSDPGLNAIAGVKLYPWEMVGFRLDVRYLVRFGTTDAEVTSHDLIASAGVFVTFGGGEEPIPVVLDTDGDGVLDPDDKCISVPGSVHTAGCPDTDDDRIADTVDRCPKIAGVIAHEGCADTDGDTIADPDDKCVDIAGLKKFDGCADTDGDDIADPTDRCPTAPGTPKFKGCPDSDSDAIADPDDRCPQIAGEAAYEGCPPPPPVDVVEKFSGAIEGIRFKVNSDEIRRSSNRTLDNVVAVMTQYPQLRLGIEGHTSSEGDYDENVDLSKRRAASVKAYLVAAGIDTDRLEAKGLGPDFPVADNKTSRGRKKNRRIEFKLLRK